MEMEVLVKSKVFAVVGASADPAKVGHKLLSNLHQNTDLTVYPINPKGGTILDLPVYAHLAETPQKVEVVVVAVPLPAVEAVIDECIATKVKAVILITAGFAEVGEAGKILQTRIVEKLKTAGILLLGPNTMGYIVPGQKIYASFGPSEVAPGPVAVISQSGAMLSALFQEYASAGTGMSFALSLGNRTGISENDALEYALSDPETRVVVVYLESLADPQQLLRIGKLASAKKPVFLLKGGTTEAGRAAAVSHTAALATSQILLSELCRQAGIVELSNFEQLVRASVAAAKTTFLPENLMIVTNAGGPAVVLTDEITEAGIPLVKLSESTKQALSSALPGIKLGNPLDLIGDATSSRYLSALKVLSQDLTIDAIVCVVTEQAVTDMPELTQVLSRPWGKHLLFACLAGGDQMEVYRQALKAAGVSVTRYPNETAETISALRLAKRQIGKIGEKAEQSISILNKYPESFTDLEELLQKYQINLPTEVKVGSEDELAKVASLGYPVIAKTTNLELKHKLKIGAVIQDVVSAEQVKAAYKQLAQWGVEAVFQQEIKAGVEVLLGVHHDPVWGWYMAVGMGGSLSDTYDDRAYIFLPGARAEFEQAIGRTKLAGLLDESAKKQLLQAMENLQNCIYETEKIGEIEINPLFVTDTGVVAADLKRV
jgi:acetyltransferase